MVARAPRARCPVIVWHNLATPGHLRAGEDREFLRSFRIITVTSFSFCPWVYMLVLIYAIATIGSRSSVIAEESKITSVLFRDGHRRVLESHLSPALGA